MCFWQYVIHIVLLKCHFQKGVSIFEYIFTNIYCCNSLPCKRVNHLKNKVYILCYSDGDIHMNITLCCVSIYQFSYERSRHFEWSIIPADIYIYAYTYTYTYTHTHTHTHKHTHIHIIYMYAHIYIYTHSTGTGNGNCYQERNICTVCNFPIIYCMHQS